MFPAKSKENDTSQPLSKLQIYIYNEYKWDLHIKNRLWQANVIIYNIPSVIKFIEPER